MAFRFRKQKANTYVPEEVQQYYSGARRERTGVAWLLALGTLLVTLLVAAGLFWAGRWAYRAIVKNDNNKKPATTQTAQTGTSSTSTSTPSSGASNTNSPSGTSSTGTSSTGSTSTTPSGTQPTPSTSTSTPTTSTGTTSTASGTPSTLVDTGPGDVAALFAATTAAGAAAHYALRRRDS